MARDLSLEPNLPAADIQGDILSGLPKRHEHLIFFQIASVPSFKKFLASLALTSLQECLDKRAAIDANKAEGDETLIPAPGLNLAFTFGGMEKLGVQGLPKTGAMQQFHDGMAASQAVLADPPTSSWKAALKPSADLHGVFILTGASHAEVVDTIMLRLAPETGNGWKRLHEEVGEVRPDPVKGHEHFGFADGVSQPGIRGTVNGAALTPQTGTKEDQGAPGQDLLWPGEFVFGYPGQDGQADSFTVKGPVAQPPIPLMKDGAFLVFRRLAQLVPEFNASVKHAAAGIAGPSDKASPELLGAQLVGRWKSGAPLILAPTADDPTLADGKKRVNDFEFGDDREGLKCPWAAHVRKAYPRDDVPDNLTPDKKATGKAEACTQSHRMLRRGIAFGPEVTEHEATTLTSAGGSNTRGLLFKCYVTSIHDQFEFVQQRWSNTAGFSQPNSGIDPIIGQTAAAMRPFLGAAPFSLQAVNKPQLSLKGFVVMEGGAYFFAPSIPAIRQMAS